jgi:hypothetical protein
VRSALRSPTVDATPADSPAPTEPGLPFLASDRAGVGRHAPDVGASAAAWTVAAITCLGLAAALTWPWARDAWGGRIEGDAAQFVWDAWWVQQRVFSLQNPWWTSDIYAPEGTWLTTHPLETLLMVFVSPLTALAGPMVAYGVLVLVTLAAAGLLAWRLGLALGLGSVGAAVTGVLWMSSPIVVFKLWIGHYMLILLAALLPAVVLAARRLMRTGRTRDGVALGLLLGAALLTDLQVTAYLTLAVAAIGIYAVAIRPEWRSRAALQSAAAVVCTFVLVGSPTLVAVTRAEVDGDYRTPKASRVAWATVANADLAQFVLPSPASRFFADDYDRAADRLGELSQFTVDSAVSFGWAASALAVVGIVGTRRTRRTWWLAGAVLLAVVLSLGPTLKALGQTYVPLGVDAGEEVSLLAPGTWLLGVPVVNELRIPARYALLGALPLVLLAGLGAQSLVRRARGAGATAVVALCALAVAEGAVELPANGPPGERLARLVEADPRPGVVVDVPLSWRSGIEEVGSPEISPRAMLQQTVHEKPIAAGYIARLDGAMLDRLLDRPLYRSLLLRQRNGEIPEGLDDPSRAEVVDDARALGANWIVVWPEADRAVLPFLGAIGYRRIAEDGGVLLYRR